MNPKEFTDEELLTINDLCEKKANELWIMYGSSENEMIGLLGRICGRCKGNLIIRRLSND
jgi:hypothetical protein